MKGDNIEGHKWIMMGAINLGAILEYSGASGVIHWLVAWEPERGQT